MTYSITWRSGWSLQRNKRISFVNTLRLRVKRITKLVTKFSNSFWIIQKPKPWTLLFNTNIFPTSRALTGYFEVTWYPKKTNCFPLKVSKRVTLQNLWRHRVIVWMIRARFWRNASCEHKVWWNINHSWSDLTCFEWMRTQHNKWNNTYRSARVPLQNKRFLMSV